MKSSNYWQCIQDKNSFFMEDLRDQLQVPVREFACENCQSVSMPLWVACYLSDPQISVRGMIPYANYQTATLDLRTNETWYGRKNLGIAALTIIQNAKHIVEVSTRHPNPPALKESVFFSLLQNQQYWRGDSFTPPYDFLVPQIVTSFLGEPLVINNTLKRIVSFSSKTIVFGDYI